MVEREPNYASYTLADLLDVEKSIDKAAYPERWRRLREELASRREGVAAEPSPAPAPLLGLGTWVAVHFVICPILAGIVAFFIRGDGEGADCFPLAVVPMVATFSLGSFGTHSVYRAARHPDRFFLISIGLWAFGAPSLLIGSVNLFVWIVGLLPQAR